MALGYVFYGAYLIPMNELTLVKGDTKWNWTLTVVCGGVATALNFVSVPKIGIIAPAIVTAVSYGLLFILVLCYLRAKHTSLIGWDLRTIGVASLVLLGGYGLATQMPGSDGPLHFSLLLALCLVLAVCLGVLATNQRSFREAHALRAALLRRATYRMRWGVRS